MYVYILCIVYSIFTYIDSERERERERLTGSTKDATTTLSTMPCSLRRAVHRISAPAMHPCTHAPRASALTSRCKLMPIWNVLRSFADIAPARVALTHATIIMAHWPQASMAGS